MRATWVAAAVVLGSLLSACSGTPSGPRAAPTASAADTISGSPTASPSTTRQAPPAPPRTGACYRLTFGDATRSTSRKPPVRCGRPHTAVTIFVGRLRLTAHGRPLGVGSPRVQHQVASGCTQRLPAYLSGTTQARQLSRFQVVWFTPTLLQSQAGAAWFRCDLVAVGTGERLMPLPPHDTLRHVLARPRALATYGLCGTTAPGAKGFTRVPCAARHSWVAVSTIPLRGGTRYPGVPAVRQAGDSTCADVVRRRDGLPLAFRYGWEWPTAAQWKTGQHFGYCWSPSP